MDKELLKKIATVILEHYEEDDNYFEDGYSRDVHALFETPIDEIYYCSGEHGVQGVDLDVVLKSEEKVNAYWYLSSYPSKKILQGSDGTEYNINQVEKWRISEN